MEILRREGVDFESIEPSADDPPQPPAGDPGRVSAELALAKASTVSLEHPERVRAAFVIGADTICAMDGRSIGKPADAEEASAMLHAMSGRRHEVVTSVAVLRDGRVRVATDVATVSLPAIDEERLAGYVEAGGWRGKAGGYDLEERRRAGWAIGCEGDPDTVSGLPWRLVRQVMERWPW